MAASLGFLIWNWTPARIFMGDVGSVTLGGVFAVLAIIGNVQDGVPLTAYIILFGVFLFDTIVTLIRRLIEGKVIWNPHREHFYQRAAATGLGHAFVTVSAILATLVLAALASLEKFQVAPAGLWPLLALFLLTTLASLVMVREKSRAGQP
jgi:Fuc2NAc and GlcNAc transferase